MNISELAGLFETRKRDDGSEFVCLKDSAPEWASDFVREAHGTEMLPDDYRYRWIAEALSLLAESLPADVEVEDADVDDLATEFGNDVSVYTADLLAWLSSNLSRIAYCDEAISEGLTEANDLTAIIMVGQAAERQEVFQSVVAALANFTEELTTA